DRDPAGVCEVEDELVRAVPVPAEHAKGRLLERDRDDPPLLREPLAGAQEERHAGPAPVVDSDLERHEGLRLARRIDARLVAVALVLAADDPRRAERLHRPE